MSINTVTVFDGKGEAFEMSQANANDVVQHLGWTYANKHRVADERALSPRVATTERDKKLEEALKTAEANRVKNLEATASATKEPSYDEVQAAEAQKKPTTGKK
jgi:predicted TIM-barrel enzyme